jgi:exonuclease III
MSLAGLSLLTLNIGNPSVARARRLLAWLIRRDEQVLVLTETKASAGCRLLAEEFAAAGYAVHYPQPGPGEYGTMIVSTVPARPDDGFGDRVGYLPSRAGGRFMVCPVCFNAKQLDKGGLLPNAELAGTVQLWEWIGDEGATTFSY